MIDNIDNKRKRKKTATLKNIVKTTHTKFFRSATASVDQRQKKNDFNQARHSTLEFENYVYKKPKIKI